VRLPQDNRGLWRAGYKQTKAFVNQGAAQVKWLRSLELLGMPAIIAAMEAIYIHVWIAAAWKPAEVGVSNWKERLCGHDHN
jgi:hypothetical protein